MPQIGRSKCPEPLVQLLSQLNMLPVPYKSFEAKINGLRRQYNDQIAETRSLRAVEDHFSGQLQSILSPQLMEVLRADRGLINAIFQLQRLRADKLALLEIIHAFNMWNVGFCRRAQDFNFSKGIGAFTFNQSSRLELRGFRTIEMLTEKNIEISRLKVCPICARIFWAMREMAPVCSGGPKKCSNAYHQRKRRLSQYVRQRNKAHEKLIHFEKSLSPENKLIDEQRDRVKSLDSLIANNELRDMTSVMISELKEKGA